MSSTDSRGTKYALKFGVDEVDIKLWYFTNDLDCLERYLVELSTFYSY